jgi:hypothetical protein
LEFGLVEVVGMVADAVSVSLFALVVDLVCLIVESGFETFADLDFPLLALVFCAFLVFDFVCLGSVNSSFMDSSLTNSAEFNMISNVSSPVDFSILLFPDL